MESRKELAVDKKRKGYNCAQAIACTYCEYVEADADVMAALTQSFGGGMGGTLEGTCGAVTGACAIVGLLDKDAGRAKTMKDAKYIVNSFRQRNQTVTCKELKGVETGVVLRNCEDCVRDAAEFLEDVLQKNTI